MMLYTLHCTEFRTIWFSQSVLFSLLQLIINTILLPYCFHFDFRYVTLDQYIDIYIICIPTRNSNNELILFFILRDIKMADFECRQFGIGLEFVR